MKRRGNEHEREVEENESLADWGKSRRGSPVTRRLALTFAQEVQAVQHRFARKVLVKANVANATE